MKNLIMINGTIGVGKSTISRMLMSLIEPAACLDGEWCWDVKPPQEDQKAMLDNVASLLNTYLRSDLVENIILDWSVYDEAVMDELLTRLSGGSVKLHKFTLVCSEDELRSRLVYDITAGRRDASVVAQSVARMPLFEKLDTTKIDVGKHDDLEVARQIAAAALNS